VRLIPRKSFNIADYCQVVYEQQGKFFPGASYNAGDYYRICTPLSARGGIPDIKAFKVLRVVLGGAIPASTNYSQNI